jgi:hypothetical protein
MGVGITIELDAIPFSQEPEEGRGNKEAALAFTAAASRGVFCELP